MVRKLSGESVKAMRKWGMPSPKGTPQNARPNAMQNETIGMSKGRLKEGHKSNTKWMPKSESQKEDTGERDSPHPPPAAAETTGTGQRRPKLKETKATGKQTICKASRFYYKRLQTKPKRNLKQIRLKGHKGMPKAKPRGYQTKNKMPKVTLKGI